MAITDQSTTLICAFAMHTFAQTQATKQTAHNRNHIVSLLFTVTLIIDSSSHGQHKRTDALHIRSAALLCYVPISAYPNRLRANGQKARMCKRACVYQRFTLTRLDTHTHMHAHTQPRECMYLAANAMCSFGNWHNKEANYR